MIHDIIFFEPHLDERIWGGNDLRRLYRPDTETKPIGEAWLISGMENASSIIKNGPYAKMTLRDCFANFPAAFGFEDTNEFPLLVKWIDAKEQLSVQVHPDDAFAKQMENGRGKTECWYITKAKKDAYLILGHTAKTKTELTNNIRSGDFDRLLNKVSIKQDDFIFIPAGLLHAIGDGVQLVEIQQASDITYRVYDYDRIDASGHKRPLHLEKALAVTQVPSPPVIIHHYAKTQGIVTLVASPFFTIEKWTLTTDSHEQDLSGGTQLFIVLEGAGFVQQVPFKVGDAFMVPPEITHIQIQGPASLLRAFRPRSVR